MANESGPDNRTQYMGVDEEEPISSEPSVETPLESDDSQYMVTFDRRNFSQEVKRWESDYPEIANVINSRVGDKAKLKYQPQIDTLQDRNLALDREIRRRNIMAMPEEELTRLYNSNVNFRHEYADLVDADPRQVDAIMQFRTIKRQSDYIVLSAIDDGLPREKAQELLNDAAAGKFDKDEDGNILGPEEGIVLLERATRRALLDSVRSSESTVGSTSSKADNKEKTSETSPKTQGNPNLKKLQNDIGTQGRVPTRTGDRDLTDYHQSLKDNKPFSPEEVDRLTKRMFNL